MRWWRAAHDIAVTVRPASLADRRAVTALLADAWRLHGTQALEDQVALLQGGLSVVAQGGGDVTGFLSLSPREPAGVPEELWVDVVAIALAGGRHPVGTVQAMVEGALPGLIERHATGLVSLTEDSWWQAALGAAGFAPVDEVIGYARPGRQPVDAGISAATIRTVGPGETEQVLALNSAAFDPLWRYDRSTVLGWLLTADHAVLAEREGQAVGFALTVTSRRGDAHLVRIAVHPRFQGLGIGRQLVVDAIGFARSVGASALALNTQASNEASRRLYERLGFRLTGQRVKVLVRRV